MILRSFLFYYSYMESHIHKIHSSVTNHIFGILLMSFLGKETSKCIFHCVLNHFLWVYCIVQIVQALHGNFDKVLRHFLHIWIFCKSLHTLHYLVDHWLLLTNLLHRLSSHLSWVHVAWAHASEATHHWHVHFGFSLYEFMLVGLFGLVLF